VTRLEELPGKSNYFPNSDPAQWQTRIPTYAKVKYQSVYPSVDLIYYGPTAALPSARRGIFGAHRARREIGKQVARFATRHFFRPGKP
jgi:hypothetical protein